MDSPRPHAGEEPPSAGRAFGAFRHRDFRLFWGGALVSHIGSWMQQVAQGWLIYELTGSAFLVGLSGVFLSVPFVLMSFYAGTVVDRVDRKKLLVWIELLNLLINVGVGLLIWTGSIQVWHIYASNIGHALIGAFENPTRGSLLPHLVPRADLMTAVSLNSMLRRGSQIIGPALGGVSVATFGVAITYFFHAAAQLVLVGSVVLIRTTNPVSERSAGHPLQAVIDGLSYVRSQGVIATLIVMETFFSLFASFNPMLVVFAKDVFGMGPQGFGLLQSAGGAGTLVGSLTLAAIGDVRHKGRLIIVGGFTYGVALIAFAFCPSGFIAFNGLEIPWFWLALPILAVVGAADIVVGSTRMTIIQLLAKRDMLGRVMSLHGISTRGLGPFGGSNLGAMAEVVGIRSALALGALVCIAVTLVVATQAPRVRQFVGTGGASAPERDARRAVPGRAYASTGLRTED